MAVVMLVGSVAEATVVPLQTSNAVMGISAVTVMKVGSTVMKDGSKMVGEASGMPASGVVDATEGRVGVTHEQPTSVWATAC